MRIAIGPGEVAGYFARLKAGFDELGVECEHFSLGVHSFGYAAEHHFLSGANAAAARLLASSNGLVRLAGRAARFLIKFAVLLYAVARYDVFIFSGSESFLRLHDLKLLKVFGRRIIVIFLGTDARPPYLSGRHLDDEGGLLDPVAGLAETREIHDRVRRMERYADCIVNHTATDQFFTRPYVRFLAIGMPIFADNTPAEEPRPHKKIRIVHAPSRPLAKGSNVFRRVVGELRAEGFEIEFVELVGVPNARVLEELRRCDFILDELYSDTPMAMFAAEAAVFGKPAVVAGYYAEDFIRDNPGPKQPPSLYVHPSKVKEAVRGLIEDEQLRLRLGEKARDFVREEWSAASVAARIVRVAGGDVPSEWLAYPNRSQCYFWGAGLSSSDWHKQVRAYIDVNGVGGLYLSNNPSLVDGIDVALAPEMLRGTADRS